MLNFIKFFILPSNLIFILLFTGLVSLLYRRTRRYTTLLFGAGALCFIIFANGPISYWLISNLESQYPALNSIDGIEKIDKIVVLPGHADPDPYFPISSKVNSSTAFRLIEAMRIWRLFPDSTILISGQRDVPELMRKVLCALGLPDNRIVIEDESTSTFENAVELLTLLLIGRFTSCSA